MKNKLYQIDKINISDHEDYANTVIVNKITLTKDFRLHWHNYYEIEYFIDGEGQEVLNGVITDIHPGVLHIISPSDFHEIKVTSPLTLIKICFDISDVDPTVFNGAADILNGKFCELLGKDKELFDALFHSALTQKEIYGTQSIYPVIIKKMLEVILLTASEHTRRTGNYATPKRHGEINAALAYIHANFKKRVSLVEMAEKLHFSPSYLSRCFHESIGMTFMQYIKMLRLEFAARLILNTDTEITDICYEAGFSSPQSFSNEFKKAYNLTPTEYRQKKKQA